ncbi:hypothetical protein HHK36_011466 [Tetracentron sinense]|uniref:Late embryogenesis abundant protein LEA-2 subgroup domain-containing protein n=1 Tax=Tetracentron sinense TaxID=13715 RepID=A0A834Z9D7_TETSI|nr:hypothetical protein HHK36_011466 [Tetracentron sinense]
MTEKVPEKVKNKRRTFFRRLIGAIIFFNIIILFIILLIWLILHPNKPRFTLQDATIYSFNVSSPSILNSNIQVTIISRNPNERIGIYYDRLDVYATYRNQQITLPTELPPTYQGHKDSNVWSPFLMGPTIPVAPYISVLLKQDQSAGMLLVNVKIDGRVRWKVGTWISGRYHLHVRCPAYITFGNQGSTGGNPFDYPIKYQLVQSCRTSI